MALAGRHEIAVAGFKEDRAETIHVDLKRPGNDPMRLVFRVKMRTIFDAGLVTPLKDLVTLRRERAAHHRHI